MDFPECTVVVYDTIKPHCDDIRDNLRDFTLFKLLGRYQFNQVETKNISRCLDDLHTRFAVVISLGNFIEGQHVITDSLDHIKAQGSPLMCHLLDRGGYYHLHPQFFVLDLAAWRAAGSPRLEESDQPVTVATRETERSASNAHHDYTPDWVKAATDQTQSYSSDRTYFGLHLVAALVNQGHTIVNVPQEIRNKKNFCYPDHNADELRKLIADACYEPQDEALWWFAKTLRMLTGNLHKGYYVLNTEPVVPAPKDRFDCFAGVCGGLKPALIAGSDVFDDHSRVILFDISQAALDWQQHLLTWSGDFDEFAQVLESFRQMHPDYVPIYHSQFTIENNVQWFLENAGLNKEQFKHRWTRYKSMQHQFMPLNLLDEADVDRLIDALRPSIGAYVWTSNVFFMDYLMFFRTRRWMDQYTEDFIDRLGDACVPSLSIENCGVVRRMLTDV